MNEDRTDFDDKKRTISVVICDTDIILWLTNLEAIVKAFEAIALI
jgi:hypothetical protein